jgi:NAD(P)-dependent dehydrogenase (short-subunit alcohol dehydrogenase family)
MKKLTVLITGSSNGIGAAIAQKLCESGITVFLTGRDKERLYQQAQKCNSAKNFQIELTDQGACEELIQKAEKEIGSIDILINNAGSYPWAPIEKTNNALITQTLLLNQQIPYELCRLVIPKMKEKRWGRIINIGSISGIVGEPNASLYSMSKAGLIGLTKSLALELAEHNITVNLINPGWVKTDLIKEADLTEKEIIETIPQKRWIEPSEVAALVNYLISQEACGITGQSINLCAGLSLG